MLCVSNGDLRIICSHRDPRFAGVPNEIVTQIIVAIVGLGQGLKINKV